MSKIQEAYELRCDYLRRVMSLEDFTEGYDAAKAEPVDPWASVPVGVFDQETMFLHKISTGYWNIQFIMHNGYHSTVACGFNADQSIGGEIRHLVDGEWVPMEERDSERPDNNSRRGYHHLKRSISAEK